MHYSYSIFVVLPVVSIFVRKTCTLEYILQSQCLLYSQEERQAISKGFVWIQTFHLWDSWWMATCWAKQIYLSSQKDTSSSTEIIEKFVLYCISLVCVPFEYWYKRSMCCKLWIYCSATCQQCRCVESVLVQGTSLTFNHGCGLSALHYGPILLQRAFSTAAADVDTHITCRPLINQKRASSQLWPSATQTTFS